VGIQCLVESGHPLYDLDVLIVEPNKQKYFYSDD